MTDLIKEVHFKRSDFGSFGWLKEGPLTPVYDVSFFAATDSLMRLSFRARESKKLILQSDTDFGSFAWIFKVVEVPFDVSFFTAIEALSKSFRLKEQESLSVLQTDFDSFGWVNTASGVVAVNFMRSMRMGIEYEGILEDVTPDDSNDLTSTGILYIGGAGDVEVTGIQNDDGTSVVLVAVPAGTWLNFIRVKRVWAANTTATNIVLAR